MGQRVPPYPDDPAAIGQRAVAKRLEQSRHKFAPGQVAGTAKEDKIKAHNRAHLECGYKKLGIYCNFVSYRHLPSDAGALESPLA